MNDVIHLGARRGPLALFDSTLTSDAVFHSALDEHFGAEPKRFKLSAAGLPKGVCRDFQTSKDHRADAATMLAEDDGKTFWPGRAYWTRQLSANPGDRVVSSLSPRKRLAEKPKPRFTQAELRERRRVVNEVLAEQRAELAAAGDAEKPAKGIRFAKTGFRAFGRG